MESTEVVLKPSGDDKLMRLILHPREIVTETGIFDENQLLSPVKKDSKDKKSPVAWSVGLRKAFSTEHDAHMYGCRTAKIARAEKFKLAVAKSSDAKESREPNYLGFYELVHSEILAVDINSAVIGIEQKTEHGETAHCNINMKPSGEVTRGEWSDAKTRFISALSVMLSGPKKHICEEDEDLRAVLEKVDLPELPRPPAEA